ncbi:hypothetical protein C8F01DRAFT_1089841 [Mycena amicta]|nr:hypothetical protein C8F01DRAFT_1089841 [Mycena amicta]
MSAGSAMRMCTDVRDAEREMAQVGAQSGVDKCEDTGMTVAETGDSVRRQVTSAKMAEEKKPNRVDCTRRRLRMDGWMDVAPGDVRRRIVGRRMRTRGVRGVVTADDEASHELLSSFFYSRDVMGSYCADYGCGCGAYRRVWRFRAQRWRYDGRVWRWKTRCLDATEMDYARRKPRVDECGMRGGRRQMVGQWMKTIGVRGVVTAGDEGSHKLLLSFFYSCDVMDSSVRIARTTDADAAFDAGPENRGGSAERETAMREVNMMATKTRPTAGREDEDRGTRRET